MREKNFKTVLYGGPCFSYMFSRVLPTYPCTCFRKTGRHFPACCSRRSQAMPSCLKKKTRLQDIKKTRISSHKRNFRLAIPYNGITKKEKQ